MLSRIPIVVSRLEKTLPDFDSKFFSIYLMPSLNAFDGTVRDVADRPGVLFGIDTLAEMGRTQSRKIDAVVTHELLHVYQAERNPAFQSTLNAETPPLYATLWSEGLATYTSYALNPGVTVADALDRDLERTSSATRRAAACGLLRSFDDASPAAAQLYFGGDPHVKTGALPHRSGYLVGFTIVRSLARHNSLQQLSLLHGEGLTLTVAKSLRDLCA
ncbi:MAG: DUF2268 domain-containing putative Zn-dependent protease [Candidatus Eremiobacteraeota bacterium]|nr:DUF2268 domain-containing putative Zn-dependent protease [Candidatus Eremiobacteraeota bacterium]